MGVLKVTPPLDGLETVLVGVLLDVEEASVADLLKVVRKHEFWAHYTRQLVRGYMVRLAERGMVTQKRITTRRVVYSVTEQGRHVHRKTLNFFRSA